MESKKDATAPPLQREDRFADDRAMRVAAWEASRGALANDARVEASATLGPGPSHMRDGEVDDSTLPK